jgi:hypothetical protein
MINIVRIVAEVAYMPEVWQDKARAHFPINAGRRYVVFLLRGEKRRVIQVTALGALADVAMTLRPGDRVYVEGDEVRTDRHRSWVDAHILARLDCDRVGARPDGAPRATGDPSCARSRVPDAIGTRHVARQQEAPFTRLGSWSHAETAVPPQPGICPTAKHNVW